MSFRESRPAPPEVSSDSDDQSAPGSKYRRGPRNRKTRSSGHKTALAMTLFTPTTAEPSSRPVHSPSQKNVFTGLDSLRKSLANTKKQGVSLTAAESYLAVERSQKVLNGIYASKRHHVKMIKGEHEVLTNRLADQAAKKLLSKVTRAEHQLKSSEADWKEVEAKLSKAEDCSAEHHEYCRKLTLSVMDEGHPEVLDAQKDCDQAIEVVNRYKADLIAIRANLMEDREALRTAEANLAASQSHLLPPPEPQASTSGSQPQQTSLQTQPQHPQMELQASTSGSQQQQDGTAMEV
jgi:hypothetical protein